MEYDDNFKQYRFEDLEVWNLSMKIVHEAYGLTAKFPHDELFGLTNQLKRATVSVSLNIAEGSGQSTDKSFLLYLRRARASTLECVACIKIAIQENFIEESAIQTPNDLLKKEYFKLVALEKSIANKSS
ncbi:MAG: four helix bundle protein [Candidatus Harrisonbacteria bacterium CG10_big_fil_rev_8_21_14_0_10_42_17]|uniref:Four helix bundle protein n=1 Tax=Candidatus Harrisonbacteria bacterium CG10_big_fil_rev_8_21_14_0_10_42_17 TaxID=1974584 RepID=A0A2M6WHF5_9BACT|nr:MAG: four helix bundle protein [Candidatus Harrisonbacteria bacterium CG10_big_fil_rev_8_21_14_0_10_42_17]